MANQGQGYSTRGGGAGQDVIRLFGNDTHSEAAAATPQVSVPGSEKANMFSPDCYIHGDDDGKRESETGPKKGNELTGEDGVEKMAGGKGLEGSKYKPTAREQHTSTPTEVQGANKDNSEGSNKSEEKRSKPKECEKRKPPKVGQSDSNGDSSASPLSDCEQLYSSDDMTRRPRKQTSKYPSLSLGNSCSRNMSMTR